MSDRINRLRSPRAAALVLGAVALAGLSGFSWRGWYGGGSDVRVLRFTPQGTVSAGRHTFRLMFNAPVGPDGMRGQAFQASFVRVEPPLPGSYAWMNNRTLTFTPSVPLAGNTRYTFTVLPEVAKGRTLGGPTRFTVATPRFAVVSARAYRVPGPRGSGTATLTAGIQFTYPVDAGELRKHATLSDATGRRIAWRPDRGGAGETVALETAPLKKDAVREPVTLALDADLPCVECGAPLGKPAAIPLRVAQGGGLSIEQVSVDTSGDEPKVRVRFSAPVDPGDVPTYVTATPAADLRAVARFDELELTGLTRNETYQLTFRKGLTGLGGAVLARDDVRSVTLADAAPSLRFRDDGLYLPRGGATGVMIESMNVATARVTVDKVFLNNLVMLMHSFQGDTLNDPYRYYYYGGGYQPLGVHLLDHDLALGDERNVLHRTVYGLEELQADRRHGLFHVFLQDLREGAEDEGGMGSLRDAKWILVTDLGLIGRLAGDRLTVFVNSLVTLRSLKGVKVTLLSENNQTLAVAETDGDGRVVFSGLDGFEADGLHPFLVTAELGDDESFLLFRASGLPLADFEIDGRDAPRGLQAWVTPDRGVYRPDDTVHLLGILRDEHLAVPPAVPLTLSVFDPLGNVVQEQVVRPAADGGFEAAVPVAASARTGSYRAVIKAGETEAVGQAAFSVEEFIPDRMRVQVRADRQAYAGGDSVSLFVVSEYLFGAPAAGKTARATAHLSDAPFRPKGFADWVFGTLETEFQPVDLAVGESALDENGRGTFALQLPQDYRPRGLLDASFAVTVQDEGGRAVTGGATAVIQPYERYAGLRPTMSGKDLEERRVRCEVGLFTPGGSPAGGAVKVELIERHWESIYRQDEQGRYRYVSEVRERPVVERSVTVSATPLEVVMEAPAYGEFLLRATPEAGGAPAETDFWYWGWGWSSARMTKPDRLTLSLDRPVYDAGGTARLRVQAPFPGRLLVTVEREDVLWHRWVTLEQNTAVVEVPVQAAWKPNVYVTGTLLRSARDAEARDPMRAFGVERMAVREPGDRIEVKLDAPETVRPGGKLHVAFTLPGAGKARIAVAAVDSGILQLTGFKTPDPYAFFYGTRRLATQPMDLYGFVLPELPEETGPVGGDAGRRERLLGRPQVRRVKPVALWSGLVQAGPDGRGSVDLDLPPFDGELTVMAVAFRGAGFGAGDRAVRVRSPLTLEPTLPRFLGFGDAFSIPVQVFNGTRKAGTFAVTVDGGPQVAIESEPRQTISLPAGGAGFVRFSARVGHALAPARIVVEGSGNGETRRVETELPVRSSRQLENFGGSGAARAGKEAAVTFPANLLRGTDRYTLVVSGLPEARFGPGLGYLLHYPYGCIEQTTSGAFPLLYFDEVARAAAPDVFRNNPSAWYVQEGIRRIESMMTPRGSFSYWPGGGYGNYWCSVYASHFLAEAKAKGYVVSDRVIRSITENLKATARGDHPEPYGYGYGDGYGDPTRVYAAYVLALLGEPDRNTMNYYREQKLAELSPAARAQLALAYALAGDKPAARSLLPATVVPSAVERETGGFFNSPVRETAIQLMAYLAIDPDHTAVPGLLRALIDSAPLGAWGSTQETAFALMALGKAFARLRASTFTGDVLADGRVLKHFVSGETSTLTRDDLKGKAVTLRVQGNGTAYFWWEADGIVSDGGPQAVYDHDLVARRQYLNRDGAPLALDQVKQGDLVVAQVTVSGAKRDLKNVAVVDMLPACFEVENARLASRESLPWIPERNPAVDYLDLRDDRVLLFLSATPSEPFTYFYTLRAVTSGMFMLPAVKAEAMYDPAVTSVSGPGVVTVRP